MLPACRSTQRSSAKRPWIGLNLDRMVTARDRKEYLLVSKRTIQVLETDAGAVWKPSKRPPTGTSLDRSSSNLPDRVIRQLSGLPACRGRLPETASAPAPARLHHGVSAA